MRIGIIGYGKMGKAVEQIAISRGHEITAIIDIDNADGINEEFASKIDVAIEFTAPAVTKNNIYSCLKNKIPIVTGSTGWEIDLDDIKDKCSKNNTSMFWASNFSVGVNIFREINEKLAFLLNKFDSHEARISETHHTHKLDAPSGTAITLANDIIKNHDNYVNWMLKPSDDIHKLEISSFREGETIGDHKITWENDIDTITIEHSAKNRKGFAQGAVLAAEYLKGKKGLFTMRDLLNIK